ncbi:MAG: nucleotidyl transferase AbiEii/AbiGii toxin family protein [Acidobacteria bacterium]|nr:nucleotidyl transferase AbiEii/AbiGii toxin family protein [Acidobacteriota bacterium]
MTQTELDILRDVSHRLDSAGISFMLTGSVAMNYYAQPRMTRDIDLVVAPAAADAETIVRLFEPHYHVSLEAVARAISHRSIFNLIHYESVIKVDCILLKNEEPFRQEEFARRKKISLGDFQTWITSREDLILSKLVWAKDSRSEMQLRDVRNLLASDCEMEYLRSRAAMLGVEDLLEGVLANDE